MKNFFRVVLGLVATITWSTYVVTRIVLETDLTAMILGYIGGIAVGVGIAVFMMWLFDWLD